MHYVLTLDKGPLFLIPGLIIALYVTGQSLRKEQAIEMRRYLFNKRRKEGGWGLWDLDWASIETETN